MHILFRLQPADEFFELPVNYNYQLQSAIYRNLEPALATFLHEEGYRLDKRRFPLFVFSRLMGNAEYIRERKRLRFYGTVRLMLASPMESFVHGVSQIFLKEGIDLDQARLNVVGMDIIIPSVPGDVLEVQTLSPVVSYSTLFRGDGKKYTLYFHPREKDFSRIAGENLLRKARILYGDGETFELPEIAPIGKMKKEVVFYKGTVINGYSGRFRLAGDPRLLRLALEAGLGSKNSMGFGFVIPRESGAQGKENR